MKSYLALVLVLVGMQAHAEVSSTLTLATNYIWRGMSFTNSGVTEASKGAPAVQGTMDYSHASGFGLSAFVSNTDSTNFDNGTAIEKDTEADISATYSQALSEDVTVGLGGTWISYVSNPSNNSFDYNGFVSWRFLRLEASYIPKFFGIESSDTYFKLSARHNLTENFGVLGHVGSSSFGDNAKIGFKSYNDYRAGLFLSSGPYNVETAFTSTNRKDLNDKEQKDKAVTFSLVMAIK